MAQKVIVKLVGTEPVKYDVSQVEYIAFEEKAIIDDDHEWVDLGLPSGTLWATCNVGANSPEEFGNFFAWGETEPKTEYGWSTYKWCNGSEDTMTKYCTNSSEGYNGFTDSKTLLDPEDDAATMNWGSEWQMPSYNQINELKNGLYTTTEWTTMNGKNGRKITSKINGNSIFLPAAGWCYGTSLNDAGCDGFYWSRSLNTGSSVGAYGQCFYSLGTVLSNYFRYCGHSVRPVRVQN